MGKEKQIQHRINVIQSTCKITQAMKMVATAKLQKTKRRLRSVSFCGKALRRIMAQTVASIPQSLHRDYFMAGGSGQTLYVVLTADRGLCGSFNHIIFNKVAEEQARARRTTDVCFLPIGKKGADFFKRNEYRYLADHVHVGKKLNLAGVEGLRDFLVKGFVQGTYKKVMLIYQPYSQGEVAQVAQLLPLSSKKKQQDRSSADDFFLYEPSKQAIIEYVLPRAFTLELYEKLLQHQLAEHTARMLTMSKATDNATDLTKQLRIQYNRMRQAAITKGIIEVTAGLQQ